MRDLLSVHWIKGSYLRVVQLISYKKCLECMYTRSMETIYLSLVQSVQLLYAIEKS